MCQDPYCYSKMLLLAIIRYSSAFESLTRRKFALHSLSWKWNDHVQRMFWHFPPSPRFSSQPSNILTYTPQLWPAIKPTKGTRCGPQTTANGAFRWHFDFQRTRTADQIACPKSSLWPTFRAPFYDGQTDRQICVYDGGSTVCKRCWPNEIEIFSKTAGGTVKQ